MAFASRFEPHKEATRVRQVPQVKVMGNREKVTYTQVFAKPIAAWFPGLPVKNETVAIDKSGWHVQNAVKCPRQINFERTSFVLGRYGNHTESRRHVQRFEIFLLVVPIANTFISLSRAIG
jgi:hypothetical protein